MKAETKKKNIDCTELSKALLDNYVKPNITIAIKIHGYGFADGFGNNKFKETPHYGILLVGQSKRWVCYMMFDDEIPEGYLVEETVKYATNVFMIFKRPYAKRYKQSVRKMILIKMFKTMTEQEINALDNSDIF